MVSEVRGERSTCLHRHRFCRQVSDTGIIPLVIGTVMLQELFCAATNERIDNSGQSSSECSTGLFRIWTGSNRFPGKTENHSPDEIRTVIMRDLSFINSSFTAAPGTAPIQSNYNL